MCGPDCILSSNTSTIDIDLIGQKTKSQDRIIGAHFFSPAHIMPLLEIVRTEKTSKQVLDPHYQMCNIDVVLVVTQLNDSPADA